MWTMATWPVWTMCPCGPVYPSISYRHLNNVLHYNVLIATMSLGDKNLSENAF